jgi:hypothetical protein
VLSTRRRSRHDRGRLHTDERLQTVNWLIGWLAFTVWTAGVVFVVVFIVERRMRK